MTRLWQPADRARRRKDAGCYSEHPPRAAEQRCAQVMNEKRRGAVRTNASNHECNFTPRETAWVSFFKLIQQGGY